ncbi:hypothetical protein CTAYLR_004130 [Chrysophaeum taylorii]|uniref:GRF-type domain-containing protein n=1 Tax=Chrysophaeum taylorii TaxID=2483200 RepID=A0AAD7XM72_9STRA|nr:hypothetical protein CTAYLR_004130 [Chrysophaeum taylorii]
MEGDPDWEPSPEDEEALYEEAAAAYGEESLARLSPTPPQSPPLKRTKLGNTQEEEEQPGAHACGTCGHPCVVRMSLTQKNPNRKFYKCEACGYFKWADEASSSSPRSKNHGSAPVPSSPQQQISGGDAHACGTCGQPCVLRTSLTQKNPNRRFYKCDPCSYFKWADEADVSSSPRSKNHGSAPVPSSPQQQISGDDAHACGTCGQPCIVRASLTQKNPNRKCYKCEACGYFKWADEAPSSSPRSKNHGSSPVPSSPQQQISGGDAHACGTCGQPCVVHTSLTQKNPNRKFYKCEACGYFKWADEAPSSSPRTKNHGSSPVPSSPQQQISGGDAHACGSCGQPCVLL